MRPKNLSKSTEMFKKFHGHYLLHNRMFELLTEKRKREIFPYKFCSYFTGRGFACWDKS